jgi:hypothetical protein
MTYTAGRDSRGLGTISRVGLRHGKGSAEESSDEERGRELHVEEWFLIDC